MAYIDIFVLGAFTLLYFSARGVSENMPNVFAFTMKGITRVMNRNILISYFMGALSSVFNFSALRASLTTLGFVNSGLMKLPQAAAFVLGSFLGIGIISWSLFLFPGIFKFSLILTGLFFAVFGLETRWQHIGKLFFYLGCTLLGLELFVSSLSSKGSGIVFYLNQIQFIGKPGFVLLSFALTLVFRSSYCVLGTIIAFLVTQKIMFADALYMVAGLYVGEIFPLFIFTRKAHRETKFAVAIALFSAVFGVMVLISALHFFNIGLEGKVEPDLAELIGFYNIGSIIIGLVGLSNLKLFINFLNSIFPKVDQSENRKIQLFSAPSLLSATVVLENLEQETTKLFVSLKLVAASTSENLKNNQDKMAFEKVRKNAAIINRIQNEMYSFIKKANEFSLNSDQAQTIAKIQLLTFEFDKIAQNCLQILTQSNKKGKVIGVVEKISNILQKIKPLNLTKNDFENHKKLTTELHDIVGFENDPLCLLLTENTKSICQIIGEEGAYKQFDFTSFFESKRSAIGL